MCPRLFKLRLTSGVHTCVCELNKIKCDEIWCGRHGRMEKHEMKPLYLHWPIRFQVIWTAWITVQFGCYGSDPLHTPHAVKNSMNSHWKPNKMKSITLWPLPFSIGRHENWSIGQHSDIKKKRNNLPKIVFQSKRNPKPLHYFMCMYFRWEWHFIRNQFVW